MARAVMSLLAGILFGFGLAVSQMVNPAKVLAFLDVAGSWDPSLAFVMLGAVGVYAAVLRLVRRPRPLFADQFRLPTARSIDARLAIGAVVFGLGWGLVGYCPGPAIASLAYGKWQTAVFVMALVAGSALARLVQVRRSTLDAPTG